MTIKALIKRECRIIFIKEPLIAFLLLGIATIYLLLMGTLYSANVVNNVPLVVYDQDQTALSRSLIQTFVDSEKYQVVAQVLSQEDMEALMREKVAYSALSIPHDFSRNIKKGNGSEILLEINGANIVFANTVIGSAQEIVGTFSSHVGVGLVESIGQLPNQSIKKVAPFQSRIRVLNNPTLNYTSFFVLGVLFTAFQSGILMAVGMSMINEYQNFVELKNVAPGKVLFAKIVPYLIGGLAAFSCAMLIAVELFNIPFKGNICSMLLLIGAFIFVIASLATLIAALCHDKVTLIQLSVAYAVPSFLFSGYTWPQHAMNMFSKIVSFTFPLTYTADNLRDLSLNGYAPALQSSIVILVVLGVLLLGLSTMFYARQRKRSLQLYHC